MLASLSLVLLGAAASVTPCETLDAMSTPQVQIRATSTPAGPFVAPGTPAAAPAPAGAPGAAGRGGPGGAQAAGLPAHCRVRLVLRPTSDSNINATIDCGIVNMITRFTPSSAHALREQLSPCKKRPIPRPA